MYIRGRICRSGKRHQRRARQSASFLIRNIVLNETRREVSRNGQVIELTDTEYALLNLLLTNRKQIFSAEHLYESIWQEEYYYGANNTVMVHMRNLRCKIEKDPKNPTIIKTVWGRGYRCD